MLTLCKINIKMMDMKKLEFKENQRFRQLDVLLLLSFLIIGLVYRLMTIESREIGDYFAYLLCLGLLGSAFVYFYNLRLITVINKKGVRFQYFPWHYKKQKISWEDIEQMELVRTPLNTALNGWNVRFADNYYYSVCGNRGLDICLKNGDRVFIGSQNTEELEKSLEAMGKLSPPDQI